MRQFDASLADPLFKMPATALPDTNTLGLLSQRNLRRGRKMGLPSGQQVARLMGVTPLTNAQLSQNYRINVTIPSRPVGNGRERGERHRARVVVQNDSLKAELADPEWKGEAPLWFYILKEADDSRQGSRRWARSVGGSWPRFSSACCRRIPTRTCT